MMKLSSSPFPSSHCKLFKIYAAMSVMMLLLSGDFALAATPFEHLKPEIQTLLPDRSRRVIVVFEDSVTESDVRGLANLQSVILRKHKIIPAVSVSVGEERLLDVLRMKNVKGIYEDTRVYALLNESVPQIRANEVHAAGIVGAGANVCIVDTGVDEAHPAIPALSFEFDFVNNDSDANDDNGHGTHVAGIVTSQDVSLKGTAPGASLSAAKVLDANGSGFTSDVIAGIDFCVQQGAKVINMSLGGGTYPGTCDGQPLSDAANAAVDQGVTVFAASGNNGRTDRISEPACASKVIAVGAVDKQDRIATYSNTGPDLDFFAPGTNIFSTYPGGGFARLTGTSMATPHAAGVGALLLSANPALTPEQIRTIMQDTAVDLVEASGISTAAKRGRIDAYEAYLVASGSPPPPPPPPPPGPSTIFEDDFESGLGFWTESGEPDWLTAAPTEAAVPGTPSGNLVAHADNCDSDCVLTMTNPLDLSSYQGANLSFSRYVDASLDAGEILTVQAFNGTAWNTIFSWTHSSGDDDTWHEETFDLTQNYLVPNFKIRFVSRESSTIEETEIDNVKVSVVTPQGNQNPIAKAGSDQTVSDADGNGVQSVTVSGTSSFDPDGSIGGFLWKEGASTLGSTAIISPSLPVGVHTLTLTVTDNEGAQGSDDVIITVGENQTPVASAGQDQSVSDGDSSGTESVSLNGLGSSDPDGSIVGYEWKEGATLLGTGAIITRSFTVGPHTVTLTVADNGGKIALDTALITVSPNQPPVASAGPNQTVSDGDGDGLASVTLNSTGSSDPDGTITSYEWKEGATVLGTTSLLVQSFSVGVHTVDLIVTDNNGATGTDAVTITVAANQSPNANAGSDQEVTDTDSSGSETVTLNGSGSSDPDGTIESYEWKEGSTVLGTGISITPSLSLGSHTITLTVTDNAGSTDTDTVDVTVNAPTPPPPGSDTIFSDDFQGGFSLWTESGNLGWNPEPPSEQAVPGGPPGNIVAHADNCAGTCTLTLVNPIDTTAQASVILSFMRYIDTSIDAGEFLAVDVFDGSIWIELASWTHGAGDDDSWHPESFDVTAYSSPTFSIRFRSAMSSTIEDTEVDQVKVEGVNP